MIWKYTLFDQTGEQMSRQYGDDGVNFQGCRAIHLVEPVDGYTVNFNQCHRFDAYWRPCIAGISKLRYDAAVCNSREIQDPNLTVVS